MEDTGEQVIGDENDVVTVVDRGMRSQFDKGELFDDVQLEMVVVNGVMEREEMVDGDRLGGR